MPASIISLAEFKSAASQQIKNLQENPAHQKTLALLRLMMQGENDIQHGRLTAQTEVFDQLKQRLIAEQND